MFERFTDRARRVVVVAQEEAGKFGHNYIGTEHLLLGILDTGGGVAVRVLESMDISQEVIRQQVEENIGRGSAQPSGHIPFTPRAKKVLEFSLRESLELGHSHIGTEHLLLGLIREGEGVAARVLAGLGVDLDRTRQEVAEVVQSLPGRATARRGGPMRRPEASVRLDTITDRLDTITDQLTAIVSKLGIGAEPGREQASAREPMPEVLRELDRQVDRVRAEKEAAIDVQEFERAVTLRNQERDLRARRDAERELWLFAAEQRQSAVASSAELHRLRRVVDGLQAQLRRHGIEPEAEADAE